MNQYLSLLSGNKAYRYLWTGNVISQLGDWFNLIASAELITQLTNSGVAISTLFLARFLPLFLFSPLAGVLADRFNRRNILIFADLARAVTVAGFLLVRTPEHIWLLYALTVTQFALSALFAPARSAVLANVVAPGDLVTANALDSVTWSTMLALGAFLGGVVAAFFGAQTAFVMDAFTFLLSAVVIGRIQPLSGAYLDQAAGSGWLNFVDGFRYLWGRPFLLIIALVKGAGSLVWGAVNVLEITFANALFPLTAYPFAQRLGIENGGTATLGIIYVLSGLGTGIGPLLLRRWLGDSPAQLLRGMTISFVVMAAGIVGLGLAPTLPLVLAMTFLRTVGTGTMWVFSAALLQMIVPDRYRGRVFAFEFAVLTLTESLSILAAGFAQDGLGWDVRRIVLAEGAFGFAVVAVWLFLYLGTRRLAPEQAAK